MANDRWDEIYQTVLNEVSQNGEVVTAGTSRSVGSGQQTRDILNHRFSVPDPRDRILWNPVRKFNVYTAIARFFWMISGSDRLKDIAFYEPRVLGFSDDALTVPGSDYGKRLFMPEPGLDQVRAMIKRIQEDPGTRRAVGAIYRPEDAVRDSKDIPCAFGLAFHVRGGKLRPTMVMRSNAAWGLLPYNVFEFTLLAELVAVMTGVPLGQYDHLALSMHLYVGSKTRKDEIALATDAATVALPELLPPMPPMPPTTFDDLTKICQWEAELRHAAPGISVTNYRDHMKRCRDMCSTYWSDLCLALLAYVLLGNKRVNAAGTVLAEIREPLATALRTHPLSQTVNVPGLEEDQVLLEGRLNLLRYGESARVAEVDREQLWHEYRREYTPAPQGAERRRQAVVTEAEWARRDRERRAREAEPELFKE